MQYDKRCQKLESGWELVEEHIDDAKLIAWDTCHKIYLALDEIEEAWFREHYECIVDGSPELMMKTLHEWWDASCSLRFINGVRRVEPDRNEGFVPLIEQFATSEDACPLCDEEWCDGQCEKEYDDEGYEVV